MHATWVIQQKNYSNLQFIQWHLAELFATAGTRHNVEWFEAKKLSLAV